MQVDWVRQFPKIDVNGDEGCSVEEVHAFLQHSHATLSKVERAEMLSATIVRQESEFEAKDGNKDGDENQEEEATPAPAGD